MNSTIDHITERTELLKNAIKTERYYLVENKWGQKRDNIAQPSPEIDFKFFVQIQIKEKKYFIRDKAG